MQAAPCSSSCERFVKQASNEHTFVSDCRCTVAPAALLCWPSALAGQPCMRCAPHMTLGSGAPAAAPAPDVLRVAARLLPFVTLLVWIQATGCLDSKVVVWQISTHWTCSTTRHCKICACTAARACLVSASRGYGAGKRGQGGDRMGYG